MKEIYDIAIVGGGTAGMTAGIYGARAGIYGARAGKADGGD